MKFNHQEPREEYFLRLKENESVVGVLKGNPFEFRQHWTESKTYLCSGEICEFCKSNPDEPSTFRFRIHFLQQTPQGFSSKILDQSYRVYQSFKSLSENGYNLEETLIKIYRQGVKQQTKYLVLPLANGVLSLEQKQTASKIQPIDLTRGLVSRQTPESVPF